MSRTAVPKQAIHTARASLDDAAEYLRHRGEAVIGWYLLAASPLIAAMWWWTGCVASGNRLGLGLASLAMTGAMLWRWTWLTRVQRQVMRDMGMPHRPLTWRLTAQVVLIRLAAHIGMGWGALLILPGLWSFYVSAFATPAALSADRQANGALRTGMSLVAHHLGLLARHALLLSLLTLMAMIALAVAQVIFLRTILPSLMGLDAADAAITMSNIAWVFFTLFIVLLAMDLYWSVGAVLLMRQLEARRTGADLMARLTAVKQEATP